MTTSSAIPDRLLTYANSTRRDAESMFEAVASLSAAHEAFLASHPDPRVLGPLPDIGGDLRALAARWLALSEFVGGVGTAFARADSGDPGSPLFLEVPLVLDDQVIASTLQAVDPLAPLAADLSGMTPAAVRALIEGLDGADLSALVHTHADVLGNTDGVPFGIRYDANRLHIEADLATALARGQSSLATQLKQLLKGQIVLYDPVHGHYGEVQGDITTAAHVGVFVPGTSDKGSDMLAFFLANQKNGNALFQRANPPGNPGTAIVVWQGYDVPPDLPHAAFQHRAETGGHALASFTTGMGPHPNQSLTLVGHSYGSLVVGEGLRDGARVNNVVVQGSPGMGVDNATSLHLDPGGHVYAEKAPSDPVSMLESFGTDPAARSFGGVRLAVNAMGFPKVSGHSEYFAPGSLALKNTAEVVTGKAVQIQHPTLGENAADFERTTVDPVVDPVGQALHVAAADYHGPGSGVVQDLDHLDRLAHGVEHAITSNVVNDAANASKDVVHGIEDILP